MIDRYLRALRQDRDLRGSRFHLEHLAPQPANYQPVEPSLPQVLYDGLSDLGIHRLYSHQAEAIHAVRDGRNPVVVTPTASGKSLAYLLPILEDLMKNPDHSALLLFPLKALEQDQKSKIAAWQERLKTTLPFRVEIFDGDTPQSQRSKIKANPPQFLISNPDMLHQGILAYHQGWSSLLKRLKWIVIDELHAYRGVFGSHILQVFRRLSRLLAYHGVDPQFICLSATIANPQELAETLTGRPFHLIGESGAPRGEKQLLFVNNSTGSSASIAARLFITALEFGLKTIVFTKSRVNTEVIYRIVKDARPDLEKSVSSYRAGFLPEERRGIERKLTSGELQGVISTSALELGIDIGGLDVCILVGYPGSMMSFWQRSGRVGRRGDASAIVMVAGYDALDQYFMANPMELIGRPCEAALVNEENEEILKAHLPAAAAEIPLMRSDPFIDIKRHANILEALEREGVLAKSASGNQWFPGSRRPHAAVSLRNVGGTFEIRLTGEKRSIGEISGSSVFRECHQGAVYLHCGQQYRVEHLDFELKEVRVEPVQATYYTMVRSDKQTEIVDVRASRTVRSLNVHLGKVKVTETYHSYERRRLYSQELLSVEPLDLPPQSYITNSVWIEIPGALGDELAQDDLHFMGGIHAVEHAAISLIPLFCLCDRNDIGGISFTRHPQLSGGAIFFYDGYPGGAGIAEHIFDVIEDILHRTLSLISKCACEVGCPSCIQSPKCGSGNKPLDKRASIYTLEWLLRDPACAVEAVNRMRTGEIAPLKESDWIPRALPQNRRICVFDLETQKSAEEVGGWGEIRQMRLAVAAVWDSADDRVFTYDEAQVEALLEHLRRADLVVGFNVLRFDYEVLRGYTFDNLNHLPTLDLLVEVEKTLGRRLKLDTLGQASLNAKKSADGLQSLQWFREGRLDLVTEYCIHDVEITRDLLRFALERGYLLYERKDAGKVRIPMELNLDDYFPAIRESVP